MGEPVTLAERVAGYSARGVLRELGFRASVPDDHPDCVYVTLDVPDTDDERRTFRIWALHRVDGDTDADVDRAIRAALHECWDHEIGECLRRGDALPLYPHGRSRRVTEAA